MFWRGGSHSILHESQAAQLKTVGIFKRVSYWMWVVCLQIHPRTRWRYNEREIWLMHDAKRSNVYSKQFFIAGRANWEAKNKSSVSGFNRIWTRELCNTNWAMKPQLAEQVEKPKKIKSFRFQWVPNPWPLQYPCNTVITNWSINDIHDCSV